MPAPAEALLNWPRTSKTGINRSKKWHIRSTLPRCGLCAAMLGRPHNGRSFALNRAFPCCWVDKDPRELGLGPPGEQRPGILGVFMRSHSLLSIALVASLSAMPIVAEASVYRPAQLQAPTIEHPTPLMQMDVPQQTHLQEDGATFDRAAPSLHRVSIDKLHAYASRDGVLPFQMMRPSFPSGSQF